MLAQLSAELVAEGTPPEHVIVMRTSDLADSNDTQAVAAGPLTTLSIS